MTDQENLTTMLDDEEMKRLLAERIESELENGDLGFDERRWVSIDQRVLRYTGLTTHAMLEEFYLGVLGDGYSVRVKETPYGVRIDYYLTAGSAKPRD